MLTSKIQEANELTEIYRKNPDLSGEKIYAIYREQSVFKRAKLEVASIYKTYCTKKEEDAEAYYTKLVQLQEIKKSDLTDSALTGIQYDSLVDTQNKFLEQNHALKKENLAKSYLDQCKLLKRDFQSDLVSIWRILEIKFTNEKFNEALEEVGLSELMEELLQEQTVAHEQYKTLTEPFSVEVFPKVTQSQMSNLNNFSNSNNKKSE